MWDNNSNLSEPLIEAGKKSLKPVIREGPELTVEEVQILGGTRQKLTKEEDK